MDYKNKNVLVCGVAKSGISAAFLLKELGANVTIQDLKKKEEINNIEEIASKGINMYLGKNPDEIVSKQDLIVVSPGIPCDLPFFHIAKKNNVPVWSEVELAYTVTPCPIVGITGTNGKTTTTALTGEMIKSQYPTSAIVGNIGIPFTSDVLRLNGNDWVVAEISSFQMETSHNFHPKISAVLNITPDHLNRHKTLEAYIEVKEKIFSMQEENDFCILNYDDIVCREMADKTKANVFFFSSNQKIEKGIFLDNDNIIIKWGSINEVVVNIKELQILGRHNYENAMAAIAISVCANIPMENIRKSLKEFMGVEHRIEYVCNINGVDYYNDSKGTNPDASIRAVEAMVKPIILIGGGYEKGSEYDEWIETFHGKVKNLVLLGETANNIERTCVKHGFKNISRVDTFEEAIEKSYELAQEGDCVLLSPACASWDMFESYEQRGYIFKKKVLDLKNKQ